MLLNSHQTQAARCAKALSAKYGGDEPPAKRTRRGGAQPEHDAIPKVASLPARGKAASMGKASVPVDVLLEDQMAWEQLHGKVASGKELDDRKMPARRTMQDGEVEHSGAEDTDSGAGGGVDLGSDDANSEAMDNEEVEVSGSESGGDGEEEEEEEGEEGTSGSESSTGEAADNDQQAHSCAGRSLAGRGILTGILHTDYNILSQLLVDCFFTVA